MAVDLISVPFAEAGPPPLKRRRLGWDVADPALFVEAARIQFVSATQLMQIKQEDGGSSVQKGHSDVEAEDVQERGVACAASPPWHEDDRNGHFNFEVGENLTPRYKILKKMGEGTFGRVLECLDKDSQDIVAIKVVRSADSYREAVMIEIDVLRMLAEKDRLGSRGKACKYFRHERRLNWPDWHTSRESIRAVRRLPRLRDLVVEHVDECAGSFVDLLEQMMSYDPSDRPTAKEALRHSFFQVSSSR